ncbi:MAG TPA: hypothetical protein VMD97_03150 [Candidatus Aquilonibacter sp.]|nr:hypothetical protein [Candidatus Aquilonibacter sp.]
MKAVRFAVTVLFFTLVGPLLAQSGQPQSQSSTPQVIDLHRGECPEVHVGSKIRFTFRMSFDGPVPDASPETRPSFVNVQGRELGLDSMSAKKLAEPDLWEFSGVVSNLSSKGEYQMTGLWSRFYLGSTPGTGAIFANANLTPEAQQEIRSYKVCLVDGAGPVPVGKITKVGPPEK